MTTPVATSSAPAPAAASPERAELAEAARQFEAIFVRQMLAAARKSDFGGEDLFGSQSIDTFRQMQDEHFADLAASRGSFGLAAMIEAQLAKPASPLPSTGGAARLELAQANTSRSGVGQDLQRSQQPTPNPSRKREGNKPDISHGL